MAAGFLAIASGCVSAPPPPVATKLPVSETTVFAGNDLIASWFYDLHADCTPAALPTVKVTQTAIHGEVVIRSDGERYTEYPPTNDRHPCNKNKESRCRSHLHGRQDVHWHGQFFDEGHI
jgi:hypothetical protein